MKQWLNKCLAALLAMVIVISCVSISPAHAANTTLGVFAYMNDYVEGNRLYIYWNTVDGADHYDCTVLNSTTGAYLRQRSTTSSYYECVVSNVTAGKLKIWLGAVDSSGDVITSEIIYVTVAEEEECDHNYSSRDGCCTYCDEECPHNNGYYEVETKMVGKSVSDTEHKLTITYDKECKICRYTVKEGAKKTEYGDHSFDSNGDCTLCDYRAACSHSKTTLEELSTSYTQYDETYHKVKVVSHIVCANANCGKILEYGGDVDTYKEKHSMSNDKCSDCGYTVEYEPVTVSISRGQSSAYTGAGITASCSASGGTGSYSYAWYVYCNGTEVYSTTSWDTLGSYSATQTGSYTFKVIVTDRKNGDSATATTGAITVTEAPCTHESTKEVKSNAAPEYTKISDSKHRVSTPYNKVCTSCGEVRSSYVKQTEEAHTYSGGNCTRCGSAEPTPECTHTSMSSSVLKKAYRQTTSETRHIVDTTWKDVCANKACGTVLNTTRVTSDYEDHSFSGDTCSACGYVKKAECDHARKARESQGSNTVMADDKWHVVTTLYRVTCADCGVLLDSAYAEEAYFEHTMQSGACTYCEYKNEQYCAHELTKRTDGKSWIERNYADDANTHYVVTSYTESCACGEVQKSAESREPVAHNFNYEGYEGDHPHAHFKRCECKVAQTIPNKYHTVNGTVYSLSDTQDASVCCVCHGHAWMNDQPQEVNGEWRAYCAHGCGRYQTVVKEEEHQCSFSLNITSEKAHPHQISGYCECGEFTEFLEMYAKHLNCCLCVGHSWADPVRLADGTFKQGCFVCNEWQVITPSAELLAYYEVFDTMLETKDNAAQHRENSSIDGHSLSIWKTVASQATGKLTDKGFVLTNEALNTYSDMAGSIAGVFTQETWDEQQIEVWENLLVRMLQEQYEKRDYADEEAAAMKEGSSTVANIAGKVKDYSAASSSSLKTASQNITTSIDDIDRWLADLDLDMAAASNANDWDEINAISNKRAELLRIQSDYKNSLPEVDAKGNAAAETADWANSIGVAMNIMTVLSAGTEAEQLVSQRNDAFEELLVNGQRNLDILNTIINTADATHNANLAEAARNIRDELEAEIEDQTNQFLSETGAFLGAMTTSGAKILAEQEFDNLVKKLASEGANTFVKGAGTVMKDTLSILGYIELGAKGIKSVVNWDEAYDEAQQLMTISHMDATLGIYQVLEEEDSQYMADLWAMLQMTGCEKAQTFLNTWEQANFLSADEFIGKQSLSTVINNLADEKEIYQNVLNLSDYQSSANKSTRLTSTAKSADTASVTKKVVTIKTANLRTEPTTLKGEFVLRVQPGFEMEYIGTENGWHKVRIPDGRVAYVFADFCEIK